MGIKHDEAFRRIDAEIGQRLRGLRKAKGIRIKTIAWDVGDFTEQTISNWETGRRSVPCPALIRFAAMYDVSLDWLLTGREDKIMKPQIKHIGWTPDHEIRVVDLTDREWKYDADLHDWISVGPKMDQPATVLKTHKEPDI